MSKAKYYLGIATYTLFITSILFAMPKSTKISQEDSDEKFQKVLNGIQSSNELRVHTRNIVSSDPKKVVFGLGLNGEGISLFVSQWRTGEIVCTLRTSTGQHQWRVSYPESVPDTIRKFLKRRDLK